MAALLLLLCHSFIQTFSQFTTTEQDIYINSQQKLVDSLFQKYDAKVSPVSTKTNLSTMGSPENRFNITAFLYYLKLVEVSEPEERVSFVVEILTYWYDPRLRWNPKDHDDIEYVYVSEDRIWIPPVQPFGTSDYQEFVEAPNRQICLSSDSRTRGYIAARIATVCPMNIEDFPFDTQTCQIRLTSPYFTIDEIKLFGEVYSAIKEHSILSTVGNSEWRVVSLSDKIELFQYNDSFFSIELIIFEIKIQRNPVYYVYMILIPSFIINAVSIIGVFLRESDLMSRLNVGLTNIMTMTFILGVMADKIPKTPTIPLLGIYIIINLVIMIVAILLMTRYDSLRRWLTRPAANFAQERQPLLFLSAVRKHRGMANRDALIAEEGNPAVEQVIYKKNDEKINFELEPKTIGLTKEQLEKYRNDPFWKPVRTVLFVLFWLIWLAMFAGAVAIVVLSPKCAEKQKPDWWQTKVSYQVLTPTFHDTDNDGVGDFKGITEKIDMLRKIGVTTVYPTPVIEIQKDEYFNSYDVTNHMEVDRRFGTEDDFKELIETAHNRDMFVVIDMPVSSVSLNHSWFRDRNEEMFVTARPSDVGYNSTNFHNFANGVKYLGYPTAANPVLNWNSPKVVHSINDAILKFLLLGVDGFHIDHVSQLAVGPNGQPDHDAAIRVLKNITTTIRNFIGSHETLSEKKIVLFSSLRDIEGLHSVARETGELHYVIDNTFAKLSQETCKEGVAHCVHSALDAAYKRHEADDYTPYWQFSNSENSRLATRFDAPTAHLLSFLQLTLPGALSMYYGQELGLKDVGNPRTQRGIMQWTPTKEDHHGFLSEAKDIGQLFFAENDEADQEDNFETQFQQENSQLKVYRKLAKLRQRDEALIVGETVRDTLIDDVILFSRFVKAENNTAKGSAYVAVLNFGEKDFDIDFTTEDTKRLIPANKFLNNVEISATTTGLKTYTPRQKINLVDEKLTIPPKQGVLFKF
ncbi:unnamed protein product [Caenorhabditis auriculariae]|uniref:Glycosyl hydrolase family 13 catalytic domain-containing protein n=1 Tax=Caenorhabditis auriculariae TaxID=2777116 RepID=A0A8S1H8X3_9PELO|nr:unnamed protein product [Caenorhabditis auriculariae]